MLTMMKMIRIYLSDAGGEKMGYSHGHKWTNQDIVNGIEEVIEFLGIDRMPTKQEIETYYGNTALLNKIAKTGGLYLWAENLGLEVKDSETKIGLEVEICVMKILKEKGFKCEMTSIKHPYDLLINNCVKLEVKSARRSYVNNSPVYSFRLAKPQQTCDVYAAICLNDNKKIERTYIIPSIILHGKTQLSIGTKRSSYDRYLDRWDIVEKMSFAFEQIC